MCSPETVLGKLVEKITDIFFQSVARQVGYLINYKKNVKKLDDEMKNLGNQRGKIERSVGEAKTLGEIVEDDVTNWLTQADEREAAAKEFMETKAVKENMRCFKCLCPDFIGRYRLSKRAEEKTTDVKALIEKSNFQIVSHPAPPPPELRFMSCEGYETFGSRNSVFKEIVEALKDSNVKVIGIYGPGGVGKTTMVEEVSKKVLEDGLFDEVAMAVVSQKANVSQIQEQLADRLNFREKLTASTEDGKAGQLWNRLNNRRINLVILDDVWQEVKLKAIGIPVADGSNGCKVVLTSRSRRVCQNMEADKTFEIKVLSEPEAWELFQKKLGNSVDSQEIHSVAKEVCEECGGLPVAILAVGAALKDQEKHAWNDALEQLRHSMLKSIETIEEKVYRPLRWSYDYIKLEDAKSCFLLCSLFPEDAHIPIEDLVRYGMGLRLLENVNTLEKARDRVHMLTDTLKTSCLLLNSWKENHVKMHDVIRDVAILIAKDDIGYLVNHGFQEWPEQDSFEHCSAISLRSKDIHELPDELACPQLHTLVLECTNPSLKVPDRFFHGVTDLKVLAMIHMHISSLPSSFQNLVNLRTLDLRWCKLMDTSMLKVLKNLEVLSLAGSNIKELDPEIRQLTHLRFLDLKFCYNLTLIPPNIISSLSRLEELYMPEQFDRWEAEPTNEGGTNASLAELNSLTRLVVLQIHIPNAMSLPKDLILEKLVRFHISMGTKLEGYYSSTKMLRVDSFPLDDKINMLLAKAEVLELKGVKGLKKVLHDRGDAKGLLDKEVVRVEDIEDLEHLFGKPRRILQPSGSHASAFCKLSKLVVVHCKLKYLFSASIARELGRLRVLEVSDSESIEEIVRNEREGEDEEVVIFHQLETLKLWNLPNLRRFYTTEKKSTTEGNPLAAAEPLFSEKVAFPKLEEIYIRQLELIKEIWHTGLNKKEFCANLTTLEIQQCDSLRNIFSLCSAINLVHLHTLKIESCSNVEEIIGAAGEGKGSNEEILAFPELKSLRLVGLPSLKAFRHSSSTTQSLFYNKVAFPKLEKIYIRQLELIKEIWHTGLNKKKFYANLTTLEIQQCDSLRNVFSLCSAINLVHLHTLKIESCSNMEEIIGAAAVGKGSNDEILAFPELKSLRLVGLPSLKAFRRSSSTTQSLFYNKVAFPKLEEIYIEQLEFIREIWDHQSLQLQEEVSFCQLKSLNVYNCSKLVHVIPSSMVPRLQNLESLDIRNCDSVICEVEWCNSEERSTGASEAMKYIPRLKTLNLYSLANLRDTGLNKKEFYANLTTLEIQQCDSLRNVFSHCSAINLVHLQTLKIQSCSNVDEIIGAAAEGKGSNDEILAFPELKSLRLVGLPSLKAFRCSSGFDEVDTAKEVDLEVVIPPTQSLFDHKVAFPKLEELYISLVGSNEIDLGHIQAVWLRQIRILGIECCDKGSTVISLNLLQRFQHLEKLKVKECSSAEVVFDLEGLNVGAGYVELLSGVRVLTLKKLPKLTSIWNKNPHGILSFRSLTVVAIMKCHLLRNLFSSVVAVALEGLQVLLVKSCDLVEEIIADEGGDEVVDDIAFPRLKYLLLENLPNLLCFCNENCAFSLPSLKEVGLVKCPKMQKFTSGQLSMPKTKVFADLEEKYLWSIDLNNYVHQQILRENGMEISVMTDDNIGNNNSNTDDDTSENSDFSVSDSSDDD